MNTREYHAGEPIAYFITWTTYGTWLPGDKRGWKHKGKAEQQVPDPIREKAARLKMREDSFLLAPDDREMVEQTVRKHCHFRGWRLHAVNARSNHVHVITTAPNYRPDRVTDQFKAWCTRKLKPKHAGRNRFWTERSSVRWINHQDDLNSAILYVLEAQDRKGRKR